MPIRDFTCSACDKEQERYFPNVSDLPVCDKCGGSLNMLERSDEGIRRLKSRGVAFPFVTTHIDAKGRPMTIESLGHLRQVERQYGVVLSAFSQNPSNLDPIKDPPMYRGNEPHLGR